MNILSIRDKGEEYGAMNSSACLIQNGILIAFAEEERFTRRKQDGNFPSNAIDYVLKEGGIELNEVDHIIWPRMDSLYLKEVIKEAGRYFPSRESYLLLRNLKLRWAMAHVRRVRGLEKNMGREFIKMEHHLAHAASVFLVSPFERAAIISYDGYGEWATCLMAKGCGNRLEVLDRIYLPNSIGVLYAIFTVFLGFKSYCDEYKVMGLASYGDPAEYSDRFKKLVRFEENGHFIIDPALFDYVPAGMHFHLTNELEKVFGPRRKKGEEVNERHMNIAAALQATCEEAIFHMVTNLKKITGEKNLCLAGGVALNSVANGKIIASGLFDNVYLQPACDDSGTTLGGAFYFYNCIMNKPRKFVLDNAYWGPQYSDIEIEETLKLSKVKYSKVTDACRTAAELVADGKIVGWFQGRMEMGPRALGNRSILADPRMKEMKDKVNISIKFREPFRPFAPSILEEYGSEYFEVYDYTPFMLKVFKIKKPKRDLIPAVTHVDGTGRLQSVREKINPKYYRLIDEFRKITGIPVILNTSFNIAGEPIVNSPSDALKCFFTTGLDALIMGDYLIEK